MPDIAKLPKWAQEHIKTLEAHVGQERRRADILIGLRRDPTATVSMVVSGDDVRGLLASASYRFTFGDMYLQVRKGYQEEKNILYVGGSDKIVVVPLASNVVLIRPEH